MASKTVKARIEEFDIINQDDVEFHVVRNIDTGEQTVVKHDSNTPETPETSETEGE
ncbi:hypothetical protein [Alloscardovia sp. HMSC034E08]|uniref:hypothetical protein n=1 Tax=Alloscardovia sp. HMSC034E08 TaxID=1739413 RepID=UPI00143C84F6|nr:hypothetical protein [Alloscardovia sp. HMSC034E08]